MPEIINNPSLESSSLITKPSTVDFIGSKIDLTSVTTSPIFKGIKELSSIHFGATTCFIADKEDTVIQKVLKTSGWVFGISPLILVGAYLYNKLLDVYRFYFQKCCNLEKSSETISKPLPKANIPITTSSLIEDNYESSDSEVLDSYEVVQVSDLENIPLCSVSKKKRFTPIFFSPKNHFHLEKYSHLLQIIKENFSQFNSDTNLNEVKSLLYQDNLDSRKKYRQYVDSIRRLLRDTTLNSTTRENVEQLCYAEFTTNVMTNFIEEFLREATKNRLKSPSELSMHTIVDAITATNNELKNSPSKKELIALYSQKLSGELGINFDPTKYSNIPEVRSIHTVKSSSRKEPYQIIYMRHGTPTVETGVLNLPEDTNNFLTFSLRRLGAAFCNTYKATTVPEYDAFLNRARDLNKAVFYVNHQSMLNKTSTEYSRSRAIQTHEITHPDHFFFMTLPLDGTVLNYIKDIDQWKKELISNVLHESNGFRLPSKLKADFIENKAALEKQLKDLLDELHNLYFINKTLNHEDQQALLMIFYSYLKDLIKEKYQIEIMVSACKDNKDRGNTSSSIDEAIYNLRLGKETNSQSLYDLYIRFFAPFVIKYEHIVPRRFKLFLNVLEHIATLTDTQKEAIRQFQVNNFTILDQKVPR